MILKNWVTCGENSMASVSFPLASALTLGQINKLCWARHFELTDSKECWIMGKTADRYSEGASKSFVTIACGETFLSFKLFCNK